MKKTFMLGCYCLLLVATLNASVKEVKKLPSPLTGTPIIDGKLDDKVWQNNRFYTDFSYVNKPKKANPQTEFALAQDDKNIYLAIRCFDNNIKNLLSAKNNNGEFNWSNDLVEFFVDADNSGDHYIHFAVNAANDRFQQRVMDFATSKITDFTMKWNSAVDIGKKSWTVEIAIPFSEMLLLNKGNWQMNICRSVRKDKSIVDRYSTWGRVENPKRGNGFHDMKLFKVVRGFTPPDYSADELSVINDKREKYKFNYKPPKNKSALMTIHDQMFVANNMVLPNTFVCLQPGAKLLKEKTRHYFDLPQGIKLFWVGRRDTKKRNTGGGEGVYRWKKVKSIKHDGVDYQRYEVVPLKLHRNASKIVGPLYMKSSLPDNSSSFIYYFSQNKNYTQELAKVELITKTFPEPGMPEELILSIAWMFAKVTMGWPDFIDSYKKLGFNTVSFHEAFDGRVIPHADLAKFADKCRKAGLNIMYTGSSLGGRGKQPWSSSTDKNGKRYKPYDHCPTSFSYLRDNGFARVRTFAKLIKPDLYNLDIESFHKGAHAARIGKCQRCTEYFKNRGGVTEAGLEDLGAELVVRFKKALKELDTTKIGLYHTEPGAFVYSELFKFDKLSKIGIEFVHPVRYSSNNAKGFGIKMRRLRTIMKPKDSLIPWVTMGYIVGTRNESIEYPTEWVYDYTLEALGSGCKGIYWFNAGKSEGSDLYYYAKAMQSITPIAKMLSKVDKTYKLKTVNSVVTASALRYKNSWVILTSDYAKQKFSGKLTITLPEAVSGKIVDPATNKTVGSVSGKTVTINNWRPGIKGASTALYLIKK
ncbi:MAG: hypothetical protein L3J71_01605 [Victivallaceae bacterium]|nr:hypothetical protein [Victivallaceae bacterium]